MLTLLSTILQLIRHSYYSLWSKVYIFVYIFIIRSYNSLFFRQPDNLYEAQGGGYKDILEPTVSSYISCSA